MTYSKKKKVGNQNEKNLYWRSSDYSCGWRISHRWRSRIKKRGYTCIQDVLDELRLCERDTLNEDDCGYSGPCYGVCIGADACSFCRDLSAKTKEEASIHVDGFDPALQKTEQSAEII